MITKTALGWSTINDRHRDNHIIKPWQPESFAGTISIWQHWMWQAKLSSDIMSWEVNSCCNEGTSCSFIDEIKRTVGGDVSGWGPRILAAVCDEVKHSSVGTSVSMCLSIAVNHTLTRLPPSPLILHCLLCVCAANYMSFLLTSFFRLLLVVNWSLC